MLVTRYGCSDALNLSILGACRPRGLSRPHSDARIGVAMQMPDASDAEQHYFQRVAEDCEQLLGPGIELRELALDANSDVVLRLRYRLGPAEWTSEGHGVTVIAAHAALREQLVLDRIRIGVRAMVRIRR